MRNQKDSFFFFVCVLISQSPSETRAVTSDFGVIMPSVYDDDVAGLLLTRHVLYI